MPFLLTKGPNKHEWYIKLDWQGTPGTNTLACIAPS
jgi:hypothetical protein